MTIADFKKTIEIMRKVYMFVDEETEITQTYDIRSEKLGIIGLKTCDKQTGTVVELARGVETNASNS